MALCFRGVKKSQEKSVTFFSLSIVVLLAEAVLLILIACFMESLAQGICTALSNSTHPGISSVYMYE